MKNRSQDEKLKFDKVLLIICDQFRYPAHWGKLMDEGGSLAKEYFPNYARLREKGLEFKNAYIASSACNASRATIYTGKYGKETGVTSTSGFGNETSSSDLNGGETSTSSWMGLHPDDPKCSLPSDDVIKTLGTHFKENGFRAIYKGKWHLSEVEGGWPDKAYAKEGLARFGFEGWNPPEGHGNTPLRWGMGADVSYVQDAVNSLYELKDTNHKWFMALNLINPHDVGFFSDWPMEVPDFGLEVPESYKNPEKLIAERPYAQAIGAWYWNSVTFRRKRAGKLGTQEVTSQEDWAKYANFYAHLAQIADFNMGIVLDALEATEQADDTLVVFLSDHGEMGGAHGQSQKFYQAYQESIHVPLVFSNPSLVSTKDAHTTESYASIIDIAPTLLSMAGIDLPKGKNEFRGKDLTPILENKTATVQDAVLFVTDDDSVFSVLSGLDISEQDIPKGSKWKGMRLSEKEFLNGKREELLEVGIGNVVLEELKQIPRFVRAIITNIGEEQWKLIIYTNGTDQSAEGLQNIVSGKDGSRWDSEMYNLTTDSLENNNLAAKLTEGDNQKTFDQLLENMGKLLDDKYYLPSLRPTESKMEEVIENC